MESEPKVRAHRKRRERALKLQPELSESEGEKLGDEKSPLRVSKERSRSKPRKKKSSGTYEEDIIDGFAIVSFKSIEDLEKFTQGKLTNKAGGDKCTPKRNNSISPSRHIHRHQHAQKKDKTPTNLRKSKSKKHNNSAADSESSGETTDHLDTSDLVLNGPQKPISRRFSDVSTRSSSGAGYLCDSESGDERVSDGSLDIFQPVANSINSSITCERTLPSTLPPVSTHSATVTTATHTTTTTGNDVITAIVTAATTCVSVATSSLSTGCVTVTTAHHIVNTTTSSPQGSSHNHSVHTHLPVTTGENKYYADNKYSSQFNHHHHQQQQQLKVHNEREHNREHSQTNKYPSVIKRRPTSPPPPLTKSSHHPSPTQHRPAPNPHTSPALSTSSSLAPSNSVIHRDSSRPTPPSSSRTPRREESRERDIYQALPASLGVSKSFLSSGYPGHVQPVVSTLYSPLGPSPGQPVVSTLYSPLGPSPGLHSLHSTPSHTTFPGSGIPTLHSHHHSPAQPHPATMFAPPMPLGLPGAPPIPGPLGGPPSAHLPTESPLAISNPDLLREELNRRFLASQDRSALLGSIPPLMRADIHQHMHQHQHQHQHMHQHTYHGGMPPPTISASSLVPTPSPSPFDKVPSSPFFRQGLTPRSGIAEPAPRLLSASKDKPLVAQHPRGPAIPGLPGFPSPLPDALHTGIPGAFQPKGLAGLHPAVGPLFIPGRELEKSPASHIPQSVPASLTNVAKKPGKWCAVHVRIAWEIYHHQQKQNADKGSDSKPGDPLRPPSHLLQGGSLARAPELLNRPPDLSSSVGSALLGGPGRGLFDSSPHSLLNSASHLTPSFPRPSPYSIGSSLPLSLGNGLPSSSREPGPSVPSGSQEWGRIHRTPPTFPSPWTKVEDREKEIERDREIERRREEDRERERRMLDQERHRFPSLDDRGRERERYRESELLAKSRSRSRSPMRNGRADSVKSDRSYDRRIEENSITKVKEERRESLTREDDLIAAERERLLKNDYLANSLRTTDAFMQASMMDRARMFTPAAAAAAAAYSIGERVPPHPSLWNPYDKGPMDFGNLRLNLQREMDQAREHLLLNRFPAPGLQPGFPGLSTFEQDRIREEMLLREKRERDYFERLPVFARERMFYENSKFPGLRPDHLHPSLANNFSRNVSPATQHNHLKRSSPAVMPGAPPPLIHSVSSSSSRGHNSPAVNKSKGVSPADSVGESKRDSNSNSTDPDAHSR